MAGGARGRQPRDPGKQARRGAGDGAAEQPESYPQRQDHELQALEAIYGCDFQDLRRQRPGQVKEPPEINLVLHPQGLTGDEEVYVKVDLRVKCPPTYPDVVPEIELKNAKGLSNESVNSLKANLEKLAKEHCGEDSCIKLEDSAVGILQMLGLMFMFQMLTVYPVSY